MKQFCVYRNRNAASKAMYPLLLNVQSELVEGLHSRVVVPLALAETFHGRVIDKLMPVFEVEGILYVMLTAQLAGVYAKEFGAEVADLSRQRSAIMDAIDLLISGI